MASPSALRSNARWLAALGGEQDAASAVADLERILRAVVRRSGGRVMGPEDVADLVQESLARVVASLTAFRGDSAFTTWAAGIAVRVTLTELRRRAVRARHQDLFAAARDDALQAVPSGLPGPDDAVDRRDLLEALRVAIGEALTDRQRIAILAELRGVPTVEIAERMGTNRNALYKLTHDARRRLREALHAAGFADDALHALAVERTS